MKINTRVRYAIRMMADIAKNANGTPVPLKDVAERQQLSKLYLSQLATPQQGYRVQPTQDDLPAIFAPQTRKEWRCWTDHLGSFPAFAPQPMLNLFSHILGSLLRL